jgi:hypothetical protein
LPKKNLLLAAAVMTTWVFIQSASAQNSGIGGDLYTRLLWRGTDGSAALYKLDANLNIVSTRTYGGVDQWLPVGLTVANNSDTYLLWRRTDGLISIWSLDPNLNLVLSQIYGPIPGWTAEHLSADTGGSFSTLRLTWRETNGAFSVWFLQPNLTVSVVNAFRAILRLSTGAIMRFTEGDNGYDKKGFVVCNVSSDNHNVGSSAIPVGPELGRACGR